MNHARIFGLTPRLYFYNEKKTCDLWNSTHCFSCGNAIKRRPVDAWIDGKYRQILHGCSVIPDVRFIRREILDALCDGNTEAHFHLGNVFNKYGELIEGVCTYVSKHRHVPIRGDIPIDIEACSRCKSLKTTPSSRSSVFYIILARAFEYDVLAANNTQLIVLESAISRLSGRDRKRLGAEEIHVLQTPLDGSSDDRLVY